MRNFLLGLSLSAAFIAGCLTASMVPDAHAGGTSTRYEYFVAPVKDAVTSNNFAQKNENLLDRAGSQGWELVFVDTNTFYFRRPVP